jgi:peptidyl-prolyl cis-trans isomerase D
MLQAIRSRASSLVVKILFAVLILTFAVWGIGDIFRNNTAQDTSAASVDNVKISSEEVSTALKAQVDRLRAAMNTTLSPEQIKELGLVDTVVQQVIDQHLIDIEADRLGLAIGDDAVRQAIVTNPTFRGQTGAFDRNVYTNVLAANHLSEGQYEALLRHDLLRNRLVASVTFGASAPPVLVDAMLRIRGERRVADGVVIPPTAIGDVGNPDEPTLAAFYKLHADQFKLPERRSFRIALMSPDQLAATIKPSDDKLREAYKARLDELREPEKRELQQMLLPDEAKAKEAEAAVASGKDFSTVAHDLTNATPDTINLGALKREDLPEQLADVAFGMKVGEVSQPVHTSFGWHILKLVSIKPEDTPPFETVKDKLATELARDQAGDEIAKTANSIDDALAGGAHFADIVSKYGLKVTNAMDVDSSGHDAAGKSVDMPAPALEIVHTAFDLADGQTSDLKETPDQGFFLVALDQVKPSADQPLAAVHDKVVALWQENERQNRLGKLAKAIADAVNGGQSLADVAALHGLKTFTTPPLSRTSNDAQVPPSLLPTLFSAKRSQAVAGPGGGDKAYIVAVVKDVLPPDPAQEATQKVAIAKEVEDSTRGDILTQYEQALRQRYPVTINHAVLDRLL